ncbi:2-amino-4-hydroxy-6-hydroxymethyldihydropteridine diphosphokinase [Allobacillus sp. GCM10007491]|uniref:2-amino-4-hydroxy-6-hydroxymethyldihydropteridine diphosphokinase n=1 Tax=Allobacillus saliphilus TaxID=2912308 RepID=A0A941CUZ5_9BACI|nr:2-amino-4-hydroxy-6-hydroxymethyldihydropteridine diphosphokinase [Allobacillus saliphilus]MBR7554322.1 2-amino-4-hydroxy-6-hydroxymethyldihydropteridine diphosphokinase [Allobacillus saliphilus]
MKPRVFIALGANIPPKNHYLNEALRKLEADTSIKMIHQSSVYETAPVGYTDQDYFLNMVVEVETVYTPEELLTACQSIEQSLGRRRTIKNGPRTIDLDLLIYGNETVKTEQLTIPHPRMKERAFVLVPLAEIDASIEIGGKQVREYVSKLSQEDLADVRKRQTD